MSKIKFLIFLVLFPVLVHGQSKQIASLNNYINFANESIHGMLIVHRLLEGFNLEVNKYVDLQSTQINFYSNKDLPENIFEDPENWFYEKSPNEWYYICTNQESGIPDTQNKPMLAQVDSMYQIIQKINQIRFDAEAIIKNKELTSKENQEAIYDKLEEGVDLYDRFYQSSKLLNNYIIAYSSELTPEIKSEPIYKFNALVNSLLEDLRYKEDNQWENGINLLENLAGELQDMQITGTKIKDLISNSRQFIETAAVEPEYRLYGKYYYYHNSLLLNKVNRYGNGFVNAINEKLDSGNQIKLMETPHFYQVIYPDKWIENVPIASTDPSIDQLPQKLKDRDIINSDYTIKVSKEVVELELYDHKMIDGDTISVNYNGDWIIEKQPLAAKPIKLNIRVNTTGKNYLLLHAENLGKRPPNTMALRYTYKDIKETVILSSDLKESEIIEIILEENN